MASPKSQGEDINGVPTDVPRRQRGENDKTMPHGRQVVWNVLKKKDKSGVPPESECFHGKKNTKNWLVYGGFSTLQEQCAVP